ncbi:hypothetical protein [Caldimonas brevitalea]|uniref:Uncharacterized protein n=1 Tax=Caldimonas brevitalea TaxID=413882 RepID=A0A0G3BVU9_9BURK|nr:hypothetical protein [Caldimonas brevitalea]AKJ30655.1 hypothetical protein AAW51_3964 [Caldimonas brevitalea]
MQDTPIYVSHYGHVRFGDLQCAAVVLETGERGYVWPALAADFGLHETHRGEYVALLLAEIAPGILVDMDDGPDAIVLPTGQETMFFPAGLLGKVAATVVEATISGKIKKASDRLIANCIRVLRTVIETGETELIDEATGHDLYRAPDELLKRITNLLSETCPGGHGRGNRDYDKALFPVVFEPREGHVKLIQPFLIEEITLRWVYGVALPQALLRDLRDGKGVSPQHRLWLCEQGRSHVEAQFVAVTAIARRATDRRDFERRCQAAFGWTPAQCAAAVQTPAEAA